MIKTALITGARAPVALDLARLLSYSGVEVYMADSFRFPIGRFSRYLKGYVRIPGPVVDQKGFVAGLCATIKKFDIDMLIPTCEEVFFVGRHKCEFPCEVFCEDLTKLEILHNKYRFILEAENCGIEVPKTNLITNSSELLSCDRDGYVFKPVYSRFASHTLIHPRRKQLKKCQISSAYPWVQQQYIPGKEYCSYSIAVKGKVTAFSCYHPRYRFGKGSGIYFPSQQKDAIFHFVQNFVRKFDYTGQIGFDFIEAQSGKVYVLECNPRATSGLHLLRDHKKFHYAFSTDSDIFIDAKDQVKMIKVAMLLCGWQQKSWATFRSDLKKATGILKDRDDAISSAALLLNLVEVIARSIFRLKSIQQASTYDIEWNGQQI